MAMSLYGTRDAAKNWQEAVARAMGKWGFHKGRYNPCLYYNAQSKVAVLVHGDDFVGVCTRSALADFRRQLESRFEVKTQIVAHKGEGKVKEARVLNRIIRRVEEGWEYEAD